jgi:hydrogenase maturation protease HycI
MSSHKNLRDILARWAKSQTVIVCIGNTLKGDDGAATILYNKLAGKIKAELIDAGTVPENYIQHIVKKAPQNIVLIDSADFGGRAGEIRIFSAKQIPEVALSTHVMSLRLLADMLKRQSCANVCLLGIQPQQLGLGSGLSDAADKAVEKLTRLFIELFGADKANTE